MPKIGYVMDASVSDEFVKLLKKRGIESVSRKHKKMGIYPDGKIEVLIDTDLHESIEVATVAGYIYAHLTNWGSNKN